MTVFIHKQTTMKPEHCQILTETYLRQTAHSNATRPPDWQTWLVGDFDDETAHGPRYASGEWFGQIPEYMRMRYQRAIRDLERDGLIETWSKGGRKLSHIRLTAEGEAVAKQFIEEAVKNA